MADPRDTKQVPPPPPPEIPNLGLPETAGGKRKEL
jgi:hypothetical protein